MSQVNRKGEKPASSPAVEELLRRRKARTGPPTERDVPPLSTAPRPEAAHSRRSALAVTLTTGEDSTAMEHTRQSRLFRWQSLGSQR